MALRNSLIVTSCRIVLILVGLRWNGDTQAAILPGLACWYCQSWQAPYGVLWHLVSWPFSLLGTQINTGFTIADAAALYTIRSGRLWKVYVFCGTWIWIQNPYNLPILWITLLGLVWWPLTFLGIAAKLPFGSEPVKGFEIWRFILSEPHPTSDFQYYALMGIVFISVLFVGYRRSRFEGTDGDRSKLFTERLSSAICRNRE